MFQQNNKLIQRLLESDGKLVSTHTQELLQGYRASQKEKARRIELDTDRSYPLYCLTKSAMRRFREHRPTVLAEVKRLLENTKPSQRLGQKLILLGSKTSRNIVINGVETPYLSYVSETYSLLKTLVRRSNPDYRLVSFNVSVMQPRSWIRWHEGFPYYSRHVTRHIYGLRVPEFVAINTLGDIRQIRNDSFQFFQDINHHESWNFSDKVRTIIIFDVTHVDKIPLLKQGMQRVQHQQHANTFIHELGTQLNKSFHISNEKDQ